MDIEKLANEILSVVLEKIAEKGISIDSNNIKSKEKLLIITRTEDYKTLSFQNNDEIKEKYEIHYSIENNHACKVDDYEEVFIGELDCENLAKLSQGILDSPYLKLIGQCILTGKKNTVVSDDMELVRYKNSAPRGFLDMLSANLEILKSWGIQIANVEEIEKALCLAKDMEKGYFIDKKVLTSADLNSAFCKGVSSVRLCEGTIVTDIAKEFAEKNHIALVKE